MTTPTYSAKNAGCYVDGARGCYATDAIVDIARDHGATIKHAKSCFKEHAETIDESEFAGCEWVGEYEDEADAYMNEHFPVENHSWGRSEQGDWGLWRIDSPEED